MAHDLDGVKVRELGPKARLSLQKIYHVDDPALGKKFRENFSLFVGYLLEKEEHTVRYGLELDALRERKGQSRASECRNLAKTGMSHAILCLHTEAFQPYLQTFEILCVELNGYKKTHKLTPWKPAQIFQANITIFTAEAALSNASAESMRIARWITDGSTCLLATVGGKKAITGDVLGLSKGEHQVIFDEAKAEFAPFVDMVRGLFAASDGVSTNCYKQFCNVLLPGETMRLSIVPLHPFGEWCEALDRQVWTNPIEGLHFAVTDDFAYDWCRQEDHPFTKMLRNFATKYPMKLSARTICDISHAWSQGESSLMIKAWPLHFERIHSDGRVLERFIRTG